MKLLFIYNPNAGRGVIVQQLDAILNIFGEKGYAVSIRRTREPHDGQRFAAEEGAQYDLVVCAGGDGTLSEVVAGIMAIPKKDRPKVGIIPAGSTNDTSANYNIPNGNIVKAARLAVEGEPFPTDIGGFNDTYFAYVASFGELAAVSCFTPQSAKKAFGRAAYITRGVKTLLTLKGHRVKVTYDGGVIEGKFFLGMVSNAHSVGGFEGICGMDVDLQDGLLEVSLVKKPRRFGDMARIIDALLIDPGNEMVAHDLVYKFKTSCVTLESEEPIQWVVDGENAHTHSKVEIVNHNEAIEMMSGKPEPGTERVFLGFPWVPGNI